MLAEGRVVEVKAVAAREECCETARTGARCDGYRLALVLLFMVAGAIRACDVWRPVDGTLWESWREPDVAAIARNYYLEDMNLFYPRIDWRGDGPGYVEAEFPIYPWFVACLYRVCGYHEELLRLVSYLLMLTSCLVFFRLAELLLSKTGVVAAMTVFALSPMAVRLSSSIQPEPLMFTAYLAAIYFFLRWSRGLQTTDYWLALGCTTLTILAKLPAAHIGLLFACICLQRFGLRALRRWDLWLFAALSLGVPLAWYWHARDIWLAYGNSLGISNEAYVRMSSLNFLQAFHATIPGLVKIEVANVWTPAGVLLGLVGLYVVRKDPKASLLAFWFNALVIFYLCTGRTTGEDWAAYYHIVSTPLAALLIGAAVAKANRIVPARQALGSRSAPRPELAIRGIVRKLVPCAIVVCYAATLLAEVRQVVRNLHPHQLEALYASAVAFRDDIKQGSLIVASGAPEHDAYGLKSAYNVPYMFYWTGTKGFTIGDGEQSVDKIEEFRQRGARYYIVERRSLKAKPGFEKSLKSRYRLLQQRPNAILLELTSPPLA